MCSIFTIIVCRQWSVGRPHLFLDLFVWYWMWMVPDLFYFSLTPLNVHRSYSARLIRQRCSSRKHIITIVKRRGRLSTWAQILYGSVFIFSTLNWLWNITIIICLTYYIKKIIIYYSIIKPVFIEFIVCSLLFP